MKKTKKGKGKLHGSDKGKKFFRKQLPVIAVIATFLLCAVLLAGISKPTGHSVATDLVESTSEGGSIYNFFRNWEEGKDMGTGIAKYLFWFMLTGIIWGALSAAAFPRSPIFQALIAIPSGFLATAYITPDEVFAVLQSWNALGITLTFVMPFMIALLISSMLFSAGGKKKMTAGKVVIGILLWVTLAVVYLYKTVVEGWFFGNLEFAKVNLPLVLSFMITLATVIVVIANKKFRMWMWTLGLEIRALTGQLTPTQLKESLDAVHQMAEIHKAISEAKVTAR